jgi:streptogramin lyase
MSFAPQVDGGIAETEFGIDSKGGIWISEVDMSRFGYFDPESLTYTRIDPPQGNFTRIFGQIAPDPNDRIWIMDNGSSPNSELLRYDPVTNEFQSYRITAPLRYRAPLNTLRFLDGNIWGSGNASSRVVKLDPNTGEVTSYPATRGSHPFGIAIGADRAVWYITNYNNEIVRLDPETAEQTPYQMPTPRSGLRRMGADAVGNLWAAAQDSNKLVKLDSLTRHITEFDIPTQNSGPYSADVDTINNLVWFSERDADKLGRFNPATETFVEFPLPAAGVEAQRILVDPTNPRRVWWVCSEGCSVGYIETLE